jgi:hypothetical protein
MPLLSTPTASPAKEPRRPRATAGAATKTVAQTAAPAAASAAATEPVHNLYISVTPGSAQVRAQAEVAPPGPIGAIERIRAGALAARAPPAPPHEAESEAEPVADPHSPPQPQQTPIISSRSPPTLSPAQSPPVSSSLPAEPEPRGPAAVGSPGMKVLETADRMLDRMLGRLDAAAVRALAFRAPSRVYMTACGGDRGA